MKSDFWRSWSGYQLLVYLIILTCSALFLTEVREWSAGTLLLLLVEVPVYALGYTLPGAVLSAAVGGALCRSRRAPAICAGVAAFLAAATMLLLLADLGLYHHFGFHFNLFVWNLLTTPGGFASMGLRGDTYVPLALAIVLGLGFHGALAYFTIFFRGGRAGRFLYGVFRGWRKFAWIPVVAAFVFAGLTIYAWNHHMKHAAPLLAAERIPAHQRVTMRDFFESLGFEEPKREELLLRTGGDGSLDYPKAPIRRRPDRTRYNVVWLACESWRADMLNDEVMPRTCEFARKYAVRFMDHRSGGNGTRQGLFSMFYGLYGSYWHPFLAARRGALIIDWMIEDGYDIKCITSAKFSYPEFDQTIFARLPASSLYSDDRGKTYERDTRNSKLLTDFITADHGGRPFMAFMFFESPHYPYEFPAENAVFKPFSDRVDYLELGPAHAERIKNRYRNSCRTLDGFLHRVFTTLEQHKLLDNTIVVVLGDHGEEFFEHGKLGHNSNFTNEQIRTPLLLRLPDKSPATYTRMSSHIDVTAMLAPYFGVENPTADFSLGKNLLAPGAPERTYSVIAGWTDLFFAGKNLKMQLPVNSFDAITMTLFDARDRALPDRQRFFRECRDELVEVQRDLRRFLK
ncbi:MAG: sulfatase-like hydrolase/transferase [Lentisphaeria bacterium]|nr:sulfatase-like hydrolase/transferase [Lentisphaeria bacterium]